MNGPSQPRKRPLQARSRLTVAAVVDAAARILVERGYVGVTTNAIAERAGVSIGSLYQYFPDKAAILAAVCERHRERVREAVAGELDQAVDPGDFQSVRRLVRALVRAHHVDPALQARLEALRAQTAWAGAETPLELDETRHRVAEILAASGDRSSVRPPAIAATILTAAVHAAVHAAAFETAACDAEAAIDEVARMICAYARMQ